MFPASRPSLFQPREEASFHNMAHLSTSSVEETARDDIVHQLRHSVSDVEVRESTELDRLRRNYSRVSSRQPPRTTISKPSTLVQKVTYEFQKFWRHQISVVVAHEDCRDHLGTCSNSHTTSILSSVWSIAFTLQTCSLPSGLSIH